MRCMTDCKQYLHDNAAHFITIRVTRNTKNWFDGEVLENTAQGTNSSNNQRKEDYILIMNYLKKLNTTHKSF